MAARERFKENKYKKTLSRHEIKRHFCLSVNTKERVNVTTHFQNLMFLCFVVGQSLSLVWLCDTMNCNKPGSPILHYLPEFAQFISTEAEKKMHGPTENRKVKVLSPSGHHQGDSMLVKQVCNGRLHVITSALTKCTWQELGSCSS